MTFECPDRLQEIDNSTRGQHRYLDSSDKCHYVSEYTAGAGGWKGGPTNQLISNIKTKHPNSLWAKKRDIQVISNCLRRLINLEVLSEHYTIVPIPPSKTKSHQDYDDRMLKICRKIMAGTSTPEIVELIQSTVDGDPTHQTGSKPPPDYYMNIYKVICPENYEPRNGILLVDDVLTTGSHYKACKNLLLQQFGNIAVYGLFIARSIPPQNDAIEAFLDSSLDF